METSQRIVSLIFGALAAALPVQIPAASQGTMNNTTIGGFDPRTGQPFSYYETLGGCGANSQVSTVHSHMTNTLNTPVEALEFACPFRITHYGLRRTASPYGLAGGEPGQSGKNLLKQNGASHSLPGKFTPAAAGREKNSGSNPRWRLGIERLTPGSGAKAATAPTARRAPGSGVLLSLRSFCRAAPTGCCCLACLPGHRRRARNCETRRGC